jgi:Zn-dependent protease
LIWLPGSVVVLVLMSMARAHVADLLGDPTPRRMGRLGLNPLRHIDPIGTLAVPAMLALLQAPVFGWGKSLPIDDSHFPRPRADSAVVALSGPAVALLAGALSAVAIAAVGGPGGEIGGGVVLGYLFDCLTALLVTSCFLAVFNLLPIPGFSGGKILEVLLPRSVADQFAALSEYNLHIMVALIVIMPMLSPQLDIFRVLVAPIGALIVQFFLWGAGVTG